MFLHIIKSDKPDKDFNEWRDKNPKLVVAKVDTFRTTRKVTSPRRKKVPFNNTVKSVAKFKSLPTYELFVYYELPRL
jgi:hypothetical protein